MEVGLTRRRVLETLRLYLIIGLVAAALGAASIVFDADPTNDPSTIKRFWLLIFLFLMPSAIWLFLAAILCSITLRISDGFIEQVLWRRYVLKRQPISALTKIAGGGFSAMVLHFRGRKKIALPGIHVEDEHRFRIVLDRLRPDLGLLS
jgi:hypothetical protein